MQDAPRRERPRWRIPLAILALAGVGIAREAGLVQLDAYQTHSEISFSHAPLNLMHVGVEPADRRLVDSEGGSWTLFLSTPEGTAYPLTIEPRISEIEGYYWTPLYKKGSCSYEFRIDCPTLNIHQRGGAGTIQLELRGIASVRDFQREVRAIVLRAVEDWLVELRV